MKKILCFLFVFFWQTVNAADLFDRVTPREFQLGDLIASETTIGGYPIWKSEGRWRLYDLKRRDSTGGGSTIAIGDAKFFQTDHGNLVALMSLSVNLHGGNTRWLGEPCKRDDMLFKANIGRSIWEDNCVTINHLTSFFSNPGGKSAELYAMLKENGIEIPPTMLEVTLTRNGTAGNFYHIRLSLNPEIMGFNRESETSWGKNPWHKNFALNDPRKKQFLDTLGSWAVQFAKSMDLAIDQKSDALASMPSWRGVANGQVVSEQVKKSVKLD